MREKKQPTRSCVVCRSARDKRDLLRVVRLPDGRVVFDGSGKLAGRGAYVCTELSCVDAGLTKGRLGAALKTAIPPEAARTLAGELAAGCDKTLEEEEVVR